MGISEEKVYEDEFKRPDVVFIREDSNAIKVYLSPRYLEEELSKEGYKFFEKVDEGKYLYTNKANHNVLVYSQAVELEE